jgi:hypothetical protein
VTVAVGGECEAGAFRHLALRLLQLVYILCAMVRRWWITGGQTELVGLCASCAFIGRSTVSQSVANPGRAMALHD